MNLYKTKSIILASQSPRRRKLLQRVVSNLSIQPSSFDESSVKIMSPKEYVLLQSLSKTKNIAKVNPNSWIIGADTIVTIDNSILGKPLNKNNSIVMLKRLSGRTHKVYTGYTINCVEKKVLIKRVVSTDVEFKKLKENEIEYYVSTGESFDKSGGYAIQGIGSFLIKKINGSYTNVMGLPMCELVEDLIKMKIIEIKSLKE